MSAVNSGGGTKYAEAAHETGCVGGMISMHVYKTQHLNSSSTFSSQLIRSIQTEPDGLLTQVRNGVGVTGREMNSGIGLGDQ